jgi:hypothetical protein
MLAKSALLACIVASTTALAAPAPAAKRAEPGLDPTGARPQGVPSTQLHHAADAEEGGIAGAAWSLIGPFGGDVQDVAVSPSNTNIILAGLAPAGSFGGAMYRSTDGGANWATVPGGLGSTSVYDIEFAPDGLTVYAGSIDSVWKSVDSGATWTSLNLGIGLNDQVFDVAIDPNDVNVVWAGVADALGSQTMVVLRSPNAGTTWENRTPPLATVQSCRAIAINPSNTAEIYAGFGGSFGGGQVWVSTNNGLAGSWVNRSAGLPNTPVNAFVHDGTRALVGGGQLFGSQNFGLFSTINQGANWTPLHAGWPSLVVNDIAIDPNNDATVYVATPSQGVFRSVNGGAWQFGSGGTSNLSLNAVRFAPSSSTRILLGANSAGVLQSTNSGGSFTAINTGISQVNIRGVASNPNNPNELAAAFEGANNGGVYRSTDGGANWNLEPVPPTRYSNVAFSPSGTLYAISSGPSSIAPEGVYRREANGTWTGLGPDQGALFESDLTMLKFTSNPNIFLVCGADFGVAGFESTIWRTTTGGASWTKEYEGTSNHFVNDLEVVGCTNDQIMLGCYVDFSGSGPGGALRSTNGGDTWTFSNTGLPTDFFRGNALSPSAANSNTYYLADGNFGNGGLFITVDGGLNWSSTGFNGFVNDVIGDPDDAQIVYALLGDGAIVRRSVDGGATFSPFNTGLAGVFGNRMVYRNGANPGLLLATGGGSWATELLQACPADTDGSNVVDVDDLVAVILGWGACTDCAGCAADVDLNGVINVDDLVAVILGWGACP